MKGISLNNLFDSASGSLGQKRTAEVQTSNLGSGKNFLERQRYVARSTGHIQHVGGMSFRYCLNQALPPKDIQPKAENAVVAVVRGCEVREKSLNP